MLAVGEMISSPKGLMICQACDLDKKILVPKNEDFLVAEMGFDKRREGLSAIRRTTRRMTQYAATAVADIDPDVCGAFVFCGTLLVFLGCRERAV